jgi:hypothetical protein
MGMVQHARLTTKSGREGPSFVKGVAMRRFLIVAVIAMLMGVFTSPVTALDEAPTKVDVCHATGAGDYHLVNISDNAVSTHVAHHGDGVPDGAVPGMEGYKFNADCVPTECNDCMPRAGTCSNDEDCCSGVCLDFGVKFCQ